MSCHHLIQPTQERFGPASSILVGCRSIALIHPWTLKYSECLKELCLYIIDLYVSMQLIHMCQCGNIECDDQLLPHIHSM